MPIGLCLAASAMFSGCLSQSGLPRHSHCIVPPASAVALQVLQRPFGIAVLPAIDPGLLAALEEREDALGGVPLGLVLAEEPVEVRVAVDRVAADDEASDQVLAELDGRQQRLRLGRRSRFRRG